MSPAASAFVIPLVIRIRRCRGSYPGTSALGTNGRLSRSEQPRADDGEDGGDDEPGAALRTSGAAGDRGDQKDDCQSEKDVFGKHLNDPVADFPMLTAPRTARLQTSDP